MKYLDAISKMTECSNYHTIALISHASKVMLKILQARLQQYVSHDLPELTAPKYALFTIGDWNAKVGNQETPGITGKFGLPWSTE